MLSATFIIDQLGKNCSESNFVVSSVLLLQ